MLAKIEEFAISTTPCPPSLSLEGEFQLGKLDAFRPITLRWGSRGHILSYFVLSRY